MNEILALNDIVCRYDGRLAVDGLSLHVGTGSIVCLLGPSGCGKTTVLRAIAGFHPLSAGDIWINGSAVSQDNPHQNRKQNRDGSLGTHHVIREMTIIDRTRFCQSHCSR